MPGPVTVLSSMATRELLAALASEFQRANGIAVAVESVGGVDAARRVAAGERFDVVILASDAIDRLLAAGHLAAGSRVDLVRSAMVAAVRAGATQPGIETPEALRQALLDAQRIGYSTGPSGNHLLALVERFGLGPAFADRLVQARPGVPVARLLAEGEVDLGFQQKSEFARVAGVKVLGELPGDLAFVTTFSAALGLDPAHEAPARAFVAFAGAPAAAALKHAHGMEAAS